MYKIIIPFLFFPFSLLAQKKKGYNIITPSYSYHQFNDAHKSSVRYDGIGPDNYIYPKNTTGYYWGLQYERITRYGFFYSFGIQYGLRSYDILIKRDLSDFDP